MNGDHQTASNSQFNMNCTFRSRFDSTDEYQSFIILCIGVELPERNIFPPEKIQRYDDSFKFIASTLSIKDKRIYLIISTDKSHSIIPMVHKHYCIEKIYLYSSTYFESTSTWALLSEKASAPYSDMKNLCNQITNDITKTVEKSLRWDCSFDVFTLLYTQQLKNQYSVIEVSEDTPHDECIVIFHYGDRKIFHSDQKPIPVSEFTSMKKCLQLINRKKHHTIFLIISGSTVPSKMQSIFGLPQIHAIYFFDKKDLDYPINRKKVRGSFKKLEELSEQLYNDILFYREQHIHTARIDIFPSIEEEQNLISQLNEKRITFLTYNLFIGILPEIPLLQFQKEDLLKICDHLFPDKGEEIAHYINQLSEDVDEMRHFTEDPKFSQIVLKLHQLNQLTELFILQKPLVSIQKRVSQAMEPSATVTVYVTKIISNDTLQSISSNTGSYISIGIFILATKSVLTARNIARKMANNGLTSVLFQIEADGRTGLLEIDPNHVIFSLGSVFRLESINLAPDDVYYVKIKSADLEFQSIKQQLQSETEMSLSWLTYGNYLNFLKRRREAKAYFEFLLRKLPHKHRDRSVIRNNMALIYSVENGKNTRIKAEKIFDETLECTHSVGSDSTISVSSY